MTERTLFGLLLVALVFNACEFNKSVNKDLTTGAYSKGDGIGCDEIKIQINGEEESRNDFINGEQVHILFNDVTGLTKENGKVFPGMSMYIVKNEKDTLLQHLDLLADMKTGTDLSPLQLQARFLSTLPDGDNEKYKVFVNIWDKKGKGTFQYELPFSVKANKLLKISDKNIDYSDIYLWDKTKKQVVVNKEVSVASTLILILEGLDGLEAINGKVFPSFSIELTDNKGDKVLSRANVLEQYKNKGVDYEAFKKGQLPVTITFSPGQINNPYKLKAALTDLNSDRRIDIDTELIIK